MIARIKGTILALSERTIVVDVQGVGYELHCSRYTLDGLEEGQEASFVVYTEVKEDLIRLHGFKDTLEKQIFLLLLKVNGIGARTASDIISQLDIREILRAIGNGDITRLQSLKGIGKKTAERIVVELRDSVAEFAADRVPLSTKVERSAGFADDALAALMALGFARKDAERALAAALAAGSSGSGSGELVKEALRYV
jgi:Holliday junction DNA helicase RuvA